MRTFKHSLILIAFGALAITSCTAPSPVAAPEPPPDHPWWRGEPRFDQNGALLGYFAEPEDEGGQDEGGDCPAGRFYDISTLQPRAASGPRYAPLTPSAAERMGAE